MMKKLLMLFIFVSLWIPQSWALDTAVWDETVQQATHLGFVCNNLLQTAEKKDLAILPEARQNSIQIIKNNYGGALEKIVTAQKSGQAHAKDAALKTFGNDLLSMAKKLGLGEGFFGSLPESLEGSDSADHLQTIKKTIGMIESLCTGMFKKSLSERFTHAFWGNYITTYFIPNTIKNLICPALSIRLTLRLLERFQTSYTSMGTALAPIPAGIVLARLLTSLQEDRFLKNQDREFDLQAVKDARDRIMLIKPNYLTETQKNNSFAASAPAIKDAILFFKNPSQWWHTRNPGPRCFILHGTNSKTDYAATSIAHHLNAPTISLSFLEVSSSAHIQATMNKASEYAFAHQNSPIVIEIEDIDCVRADSYGLKNITEVLLKSNPYLNIVVVGTAQNIHEIPEQLKNQSQLIAL